MPAHSSKSDFSILRQVRQYQDRFSHLTNESLREESQRLKYDALSGVPLKQMVGPAFGLVVEASRRSVGLQHFDVQILGGLELARGRIAEMKTGEGKTLTATLPVYLYALAGKGAHIATANDYLAGRDAEDMGPIFDLLGLSVGVVRGGDTARDRYQAYRKDVTYGTAREIGFDFLRDRITLRAAGITGAARKTNIAADQLLQRPFHFALVDEADSILIDEARTPLVIAMSGEGDRAIENECLRWAAEFAPSFTEGSDFRYEHDRRKVKLTASGLTRLRGLPQNNGTRQVSVHELYRYMENAIKVKRDFHRDQTYAVREQEILIIDEYTGRIAEGRQWQDGIHQAVQAREAVEITAENQQTASVTIQSCFRLYPHLAGMTGTAFTSRREFRKVYGKSVVRIPTNRPLRRTALPTKVLPNVDAKWQAVEEETGRMIAAGRAVLIGTRTVEASEQLAARLDAAGVEHQVLNARQDKNEAEIIALAGQPGRVTVATNMAGRGTDIKLHPDVASAGGLHVILTEIHEARRIDWQMIGRGCRQGDPGSLRIFVSLQDEILKAGLGPVRSARIRSRHAHDDRVSPSLFRLFRLAQRKLERRHLVDRMILRRTDKDRHQQFFELGLDPYLFASTSSR